MRFFFLIQKQMLDTPSILTPPSVLHGAEMALVLSFNGNDNGLISVARHGARPSQFVPPPITDDGTSHQGTREGLGLIQQMESKQCLHQFYKDSAFKNTLAILW